MKTNIFTLKKIIEFNIEVEDELKNFINLMVLKSLSNLSFRCYKILYVLKITFLNIFSKKYANSVGFMPNFRFLIYKIYILQILILMKIMK